MDLEDIRRAVYDVYQDADKDQSKLNRLVAAAVRYYNRWNPQILETTIDTVVDQDTYACPSGCMGITEFRWWPTGEPSATVTVLNGAYEVDSSPMRYSNIPTDQMIDEINRDYIYARRRGYYEYRAVANEIRIWPKPIEAGQDMYLTYIAPHTLNEDEDGYETVPEEDLSIIRDLTMAELLEGYRIDGAMDVAWSIGLVSESPQSRLPALKDAIKEYRMSVQHKYQRPVGRLG